MFTEAEMRRMEREDAARLAELGGAPAEPVRVELFNEVLEPLGPLFDEGPCPPGAVCFNMVVIPSGFHFVPEGGTRWHPTGETQVVEVMGEMMTVPVGRLRKFAKPAKNPWIRTTTGDTRWLEGLFSPSPRGYVAFQLLVP